MRITVEFVAHARDIVGAPKISLDLPAGATYCDVTNRLAVLYPDLVGLYISPDNCDLLSSTVFINNEQLITYERMHDSLQPDDSLTLLTVMVGG